MALPTLAELLRVRTAAQWRADLLGRLAGVGFPVTSWGSNHPARTLVELMASGLADVQAAVALLAAGGVLDLATGGWLTLLAKSTFDVDRKAATFTEGAITLTCDALAGPYTITPGAFWVGQAGAEGIDARRFVATTGGTLASGSTLRIDVRAESPGEAFNVVPGAASFLFTPLPGVTATNLAGDWPPLGGRAGADEESDAALRQRCRDRWATLGRGATAAAYRYWCTSAASGITRVQVYSPGEGTVHCYCAGPAGPASAPDVDLAQDSLDAQHPLTDKPEAHAVTPVSVVVTGTVYVRAAQAESARAAALVALAELQASLDIGGLLDLGSLYAALRQPGVVDVDLTAPTGDTTSGVGQLVVLDTTAIADPSSWEETA